MPLDEIVLLSAGDARSVSLGQNRLGSNAVRTDAVRTDLRGEILGKNFDAGLGGGIGDRGHGIRPARGSRRDRDDVAASARLHARQKAFDGRRHWRREYREIRTPSFGAWLRYRLSP